MAQVGTEWRKVAKKLEGEEIFEALDKVDRLEVYQVGDEAGGDDNTPVLAPCRSSTLLTTVPPEYPKVLR